MIVFDYKYKMNIFFNCRGCVNFLCIFFKFEKIQPTKYFCIIVLAPFFLYLVPNMHQFSSVKYISAGNAIYFGAI